MITNSQYEYMDEESIDHELICIICNTPLEDPRCTPCDHIFCNNCIIKWIQNNNKSCPTCRHPLQIQGLTQASRVVRNIIGKLRVKCMACGKINLERSNFQHHFTTACPTVCVAADIMCPWKGARGELEKHRANCSYEKLRAILVPLITEHKQFKEQVSQKTAEMKYLGEKIRQLENEIAQNKIQHENIKRHFKEREIQQQTQINQYANDIQQLNEQLKQVKSQKEQSYKEFCQFKDQTKNIMIQTDGYKKEMLALEEQLKLLSHKNDAKYNQICTLKEKLREQTATTETYHNDKIQLKDQLKRLYDKNDGYRNEVKNLQEKLKNQGVQIRNAFQEAEENRMHYKADIEKYQEKIKQLKKEINDQQTQLSKLQNEYHQQEVEMVRTVQMQNEQSMDKAHTESSE